MSKTLKTILVTLAVLALVGVGYLVGRALQSTDDGREKTVTFSIIVNAPGDFTVTMGPTNAETGDVEVEVTKGQPAVFTITTGAVDGYDGLINLTASLPAGIEYALSADGVTPGTDIDVTPGTTVTLTVQTAALASNAVYVCSLTALPN